MVDVTAPQFQIDVNNTADWANGDENTTVTMRLGQQADSPAKTINDIKNQASGVIDSLSENYNLYIAYDFSSGFTIESRNQVGRYDDGLGNPDSVSYWVYNGNLPYTVNPGDVPTEPNYKTIIFTAASLVSGTPEIELNTNGGVIYPVEPELTVSDGDSIPSGTTHLRFSDGIRRIYPSSTGGTISEIRDYYCVIGATETAIGSKFNLRKAQEQINSKSVMYNGAKVAVSSMQLGQAMLNYDGARRFRRINYISDSTGFGQGVEGQVAITENTYKLSVVSKLREMIGNSIGEGFVPPHDPRITYVGNNSQFPDSWGNYGVRIALSTSGSATIQNHRSNYVTMVVRGGLSDSDLNVLINGQLSKTVSITSANTNFQTVEIDWTDGLEQSSTIEIVPTSGFIEIEGYFFRNREFSGLNKHPVEVNRFCRGGAKVEDMVTTASREMYGSYVTGGGGGQVTGLSIINLTANDYNQQTDLATYKANMQTLIDDCVSGASGSVILVAGLIRGTYLTIPQREYDRILYELSDENEKVAVFDLTIYQDMLGGYDYLKTKQFYFDTIHLIEEGYYAMAAWIYDAIKHLLPRSNRWEAKPRLLEKIGFSGDTISDNTQVFLTPISNEYGDLIETVQVSVLSGTTGNLRVAIYQDNGLTLDRVWFGEALSYSGGAGVLNFTANYELESYNYYIAISFGGDITVKGDSDIMESYSIKAASTSGGAVQPSINKSGTVDGETCKFLLTINKN